MIQNISKFFLKKSNLISFRLPDPNKLNQSQNVSQISLYSYFGKAFLITFQVNSNVLIALFLLLQ